MARQRKPFKPGLDPAAYNPVGLRAYSTEQLKAEYARIRPEAKARVDLLGRSKKARQTEAYTRNFGQYPTPRQIGDDRQALIHKLTQAARFVSAKTSTPQGQMDIRRKKVRSLRRNAGYDWVTEENFDDFARFMDWLGARGEKEEWYKLLRAYDEEDPISIEDAGADMEDAFNQWLNNQEDDPFDAKNKDESPEDLEDEDEEEDLPEPEPEKPAPAPKRGRDYPAKRQRRGKQKKSQKQKKSGKKRGRK